MIDQNTQAMTSCHNVQRLDDDFKQKYFEAYLIRVVASYAASSAGLTAAEAVGVVEEIVDFDG
jgi:hypothetical protein